jgi:hypothetical protein
MTERAGLGYRSLRAQLPDVVGSIWADDSTILVTAGSVLYRVQPGTWAVEPVPTLPVGPHGNIWATGDNDMWLTQTADIRHWNGTDWQSYSTEVVNPNNAAIVDLQGSSGTTYFLTERTFGVVDENGVRTIIEASPNDYPSFYLLSMHVASPSEVFLVALNQGSGMPCGDGFVMRYDGATFHLF